MNDPTLSKKMRESLALNQPAESDEDSSSSSEGDYDSDSSEDGGGSGRPAPKKARRHSLPPPPQSMTGIPFKIQSTTRTTEFFVVGKSSVILDSQNSVKVLH